MDVILKEDIKNLGFANDVVKVRNGYGLNFLIPKGKAMIANDVNRKIHAEVMKQRSHKLNKVRMDAEQLAASLSNVTLNVQAKVGENGRLFGSVTSQNLVDMLTKMGYAIDKKQIQMPEDHIKKTGSYTAEVNLHRDLKAKINFEVVEG